MKQTQCQKVKRYLIEFGSITPIQAFFDLGVMRLAARIKELEATGMQIEHKRTKGENRFGETVWYTEYKRVA